MRKSRHHALCADKITEYANRCLNRKYRSDALAASSRYRVSTALETTQGRPAMAEFIFQMYQARKAHGDKVILDDVSLSFYPGAKSAS